MIKEVDLVILGGKRVGGVGNVRGESNLLEYDAPPPQHTNNTCLIVLSTWLNGLGTEYLSSSFYMEIGSVLHP